MPATGIEIAGTGFLAEIEDDALFEAVRARYAAFVPTRPPRFRLRVSRAAPNAQHPTPDSEAGVSVQPLEHPLAYRIAWPEFECRVDLGSGEAVAGAVPAPYAFDGLLRVMLALVLARQGGLLLHSAGLLKAEETRIFFGPSGAGKTTVARLAGDSVVLSDEVVAVRRERDGFRAHGTPFAGEMGECGKPVSAPLAALYRLGRPTGPTLERLEPAMVARGLLRCALYFGGRQEDAEGLLATCLDLARSVPGYHLRARLDVPIWGQLNGLD